MKERWFNYRPICLVCAFLLLGSVFSFYFSKNLVLVSVLTGIIAFLLLILAIYKKKLKYFGIPLTAFIIGVVAYNLAIITFNKTVEYKPNFVQARIVNVSKTEDNYIKIQADSCLFDNKFTNDNIYVIIYDQSQNFENIEIGRIISFKPTSFTKNDLMYNNTPNSKMFSNNIKYTAVINIESVSFGKIDKTFAEQFRENVKENINLALTKENTELAYSALFGDKTMLTDSTQQAFRLSGVAHLLAVSGLHIGIIVSALMFILKLFKSRDWLNFLIISIFLILYTYLCGFIVSVIRASIMAIILLLSKVLKEEYDIYNSISIAGIIIFLVNPLCIFDVSFLMSFSCVLGIAMLYKPINLALSKIKISKKIISAVAISLATTIALIMISAFYFNNFNAISIFANVILIPLFTVAFIPIFIVGIISTIIPQIAYVLFPINYLLDFITILAEIFGNTAISNFSTIPVNYISIILYFVFIVLIGRLCSAKSQYKVIISLPTLAILFYSLL